MRGNCVFDVRSIFLVFLVALLALNSPLLARDSGPAPPVIDPASVFPDDNAPVLGKASAALPGPIRYRMDTVGGDEKYPHDQIGGDDVFVLEQESLSDVSMDIAGDGTLYAAYERNDPTEGWEIHVLRSVNDGKTWYNWGSLTDPDPLEDYMDPCLKVVEGAASTVYLVYTRQVAGYYYEIRLVSAPHGPSMATWSAETTVMAQADVDYSLPHFDTDVTGFPDSYYIYVVARGDDSTGSDIWFARSRDQGVTFETPYMLATLLVTGRYYSNPHIAYGYRCDLYVTWDFHSGDGSFDSSIRYRHATNCAGLGIDDWENWVTMTSTSDGYDDENPVIEASDIIDADEVVLAYERSTAGKEPKAFVDVSFFVSEDGGASFLPVVRFPDGPTDICDLVEQPGTGQWILGGTDSLDPSIYTADVADLTSWTGPFSFEDEFYAAGASPKMDIALNPAKGERVGVFWNHMKWAGDPRTLYFDAEWRSDPGVPNVEPGFPLEIGSSILGPPGLVDLDDDGDLEIVFPTDFSQIWALHHDGTAVDGWPVTASEPLADGPVAIGDLNGDGVPEVVAGSAGGTVFAYDPDGNPLPGWPVDLDTSGFVYVSIGALGGPYPRSVVCVWDNHVRYLSWKGETPPGAVGWNFGPGHVFIAPAAIGDIDLDGVAEAVGAYYTAVFAAEMKSNTLDFVVNVGHAVSDAPTLGDLDLDGDLEILVPADGTLNCLDHTGTSVGGNFPYTTGLSFNLTSAVLANIRGLGNPEIVFGSGNGRVYALYYDGTELSGYPNGEMISFSLRGAPVLERIEGTSGDVVVGAVGPGLRAWDNFGSTIDGWPFYPANNVEHSAAVADIDDDGSVEVVVFSGDDLYVIDVNNPPDMPTRSWPMYGHDPQRTGCSDCPEDITTAVEPGTGDEGITRVSFASPAPNPLIGSTLFSYAIPSRAVVSLEIFDLRGRRVATVKHQETGPGQEVLTWHGRDDRGQLLASGQYFARLRVRGPGVSEDLTRKITILR